MHTIEYYYKKIRAMIKDNIIIKIQDKEDFGSQCSVCLVAQGDNYHWTSFHANNILKALEIALKKLRNPKKDYIDENGHVWAAKESSVFSERHIKTFLKDP